MVHKQFVNSTISKIKDDDFVIGLALGGSWITNEIDEYSDIDMVLVTKEKIPPDISKMTEYAQKFGKLLNGFTGEHVGEKRLLICLFDDPLLHVDIKFITPDEFYDRVENPVIVWERENILTNIIENSKFEFPFPNYQWLEDRFWIWIHYIATKIGRGELFEAIDNLNFLRSNVLAPLLHIKNGNLPKAMRKLERLLSEDDLSRLRNTIPQYDTFSIIGCVENVILIYQDLRNLLFSEDIQLRENTEKRSLDYFAEIKKRVN